MGDNNSGSSAVCGDIPQHFFEVKQQDWQVIYMEHHANNDAAVYVYMYVH